ncbi:hypothetical protein [Undibacterium curvum]|uniref:hypothetical protein n=1 Tax=Undibacterium curvum TaxID=2762294 RepID=UPI003D0B32C8
MDNLKNRIKLVLGLGCFVLGILVDFLSDFSVAQPIKLLGRILCTSMGVAGFLYAIQASSRVDYVVTLFLLTSGLFCLILW